MNRELARESAFIGLLCLGAAAVSFCGGCRTQDPQTVRADAAQAHRETLQRETARILEERGGVLTLGAVRELAQTRSLALAQKRLSAALAALDRKQALSAFLPQLTAQFSASARDERVEILQGASRMETTDRNQVNGGMRLALPVFTPSAWLLHRQAVRGEAVGRLALERSGQLLDVQAAAAFFGACVALERQQALETQVAQAERHQADLAARAVQGYATGTDEKQTAFGVAAARLQRDQAARIAALKRARLLEILNLWPLAEVALDPADATAPHPLPEGLPARDTATPALLDVPLETWVYHALLARPELRMGDASVATSETEVTRALARFIPELIGVVSYNATSDSFTANPTWWAAGIQGAVSVFNGFQNVTTYRQAKEQVKGAKLRREETALAVMLQVLESHQSLQDAAQYSRVAELAAEAASAALHDRQAQQEAGRADLVALLAARQAQEQASAAAQAARYGEALARFVFCSAVGVWQPVLVNQER